MPGGFGRQGRISWTFVGRVGDSCSGGTGTEYAPYSKAQEARGSLDFTPYSAEILRGNLAKREPGLLGRQLAWDFSSSAADEPKTYPPLFP